jgi:hypothetical protein
MATQKSDCTMHTVPKLWPYRRVIAQSIQVPKLWPYRRVIAQSIQVPKLWPHKRVIAQSTRCPSYGHTEEWLNRVHGAKAMATQKSDCTMYTVPKLWPYKRVTAQRRRCQSYGHTKPTAQSPTTVSNAGRHNTQSCTKPKDTRPACFLCDGRHPANYKGCMVCHDLVSARNRNSSLYGRRSNVRTTLVKQQQQKVSNNAQNNTLSYGRAVTGAPADATSNNNHNSADRTTQSTAFLSEFKNMLGQLLNVFSQLLYMISQLLKCSASCYICSASYSICSASCSICSASYSICSTSYSIKQHDTNHDNHSHK